MRHLEVATGEGPCHHFAWDAEHGWLAVGPTGDVVALSNRPEAGLPLLETSYDAQRSCDTRVGGPRELPYVLLIDSALTASPYWADRAATWLEQGASAWHEWPAQVLATVAECTESGALPQALRHRLQQVARQLTGRGRFKLAIQTGGYGIFADVGVRLIRASSDRVLASDMQFNPEAWTRAALVGARAAAIPDGFAVSVERLVGTHVDTTEKVMAAAAFVATVRALGCIAPSQDEIRAWIERPDTGELGAVPTGTRLRELSSSRVADDSES